MSDGSHEPLLIVRDLTVEYGALRAVDGFNFDTSAYEVVALIGPNGAGKTTAFNAITGFVRARAGSATLGGTELLGSKPHEIAKAGLARTFQRLSIFPRLSVRMNLDIALGYLHEPGMLREIVWSPTARKARRRANARIDDLAELMKLPSLEIEAGHLSYGGQRMLGVAIALAREPRVLLLDEPAAGLNATESLYLQNIISAAKERGISILIVEHNIRLVMQISDRVIVLAHGKKLAEGPPHEIQEDAAVIEAYLGIK